MEPLLTFLKELPEYEALAAAIRQGGCAALSGLSPITRAHFIAALCRETGKPAFVLTQDDAAARTMQEALQSFLGEAPPLLPSRDLMFYDARGRIPGLGAAAPFPALPPGHPERPACWWPPSRP